MGFILRHPIGVVSLFALLAAAGLFTCASLPLELLPSLKHPRLVIITSFGTASPEEVESMLTRPVEEATGTVSGLKSMRSISRSGVSLVYLRFEWGTDMSLAAAEVREKLDLISDRFPREADLPVVMRYDPSDLPVIVLALTGSHDMAALRVTAERVLKTDLETVRGVAGVRVRGGLVPEIHVQADRSRLTAHNVDLTVTADILEKANINFPGGRILKGPMEFPVRTVGRFSSVEDIANVSLGRGKFGGAVKVSDVARVIESHADVTGFARFNGKPAVLLEIFKEPGSNSVTVSGRIRDTVPTLRRKLGAIGRLEVAEDTAPLILESVDQLGLYIVLGAVCAGLVLMVFLRSVRDMLLILLPLPVSMLSAFWFMHWAGISLNVMSLGGLALGVGMLLDNAIVVLESIHRHRSESDNPLWAAETGMREVVPSIVSGTLTSLAVLAPFFFMEGTAQRLFRDFAFTLSVSMLMSLLTAAVLIPTLAGALRKERDTQNTTLKPRGTRAAYGSLLSLAFRYPIPFVLGCTIATGAGAWSLSQREMELLPETAWGTFGITLTLPPAASTDRTERAVDSLEAVLAEQPHVAKYVTRAGQEHDASRAGRLPDLQNTNEASVLVEPAPGSESTEAIRAVMRSIEEIASKQDDVSIELNLRRGPLETVFDVSGLPPLLRITTDELPDLRRIGEQAQDRLDELSFLRNLRWTGYEGVPQIRVKIDRYNAAVHGTSVKDVAVAVRTALEGRKVGKLVKGDRELDIRVRLETGDRTSPDDLSLLPIQGRLGNEEALVPLRAVAELEEKWGPREIVRVNGNRSFILHASVQGTDAGTARAQAMQVVQSISTDVKFNVLPGSDQSQLVESVKGLRLAFILALALVYTVLVVQFESLTQPFVILLAVPTMIVGPALALHFTEGSINVLAIIGGMVLLGIVVNNSILLLATVRMLRERGLDRRASSHEAASIRLRPIVMTTLTTVLGALPLCLAPGAAAGLNRPLALTLVCGAASSTLFTLLLVPLASRYVGSVSPRSDASQAGQGGAR